MQVYLCDIFLEIGHFKVLVHFLMSLEVEPIFIVLGAICMSFFQKTLFTSSRFVAFCSSSFLLICFYDILLKHEIVALFCQWSYACEEYLKSLSLFIVLEFSLKLFPGGGQNGWNGV